MAPTFTYIDGLLQARQFPLASNEMQLGSTDTQIPPLSWNTLLVVFRHEVQTKLESKLLQFLALQMPTPATSSYSAAQAVQTMLNQSKVAQLLAKQTDPCSEYPRRHRKHCEALVVETDSHLASEHWKVLELKV